MEGGCELLVRSPFRLSQRALDSLCVARARYTADRLLCCRSAMSGHPPSAVADFFAAFDVASRSMEATLAPPCAERDQAPVAAKTAAPAKRAPGKKRKNGLGTTGVDLGGLNADLPSMQTK